MVKLYKSYKESYEYFIINRKNINIKNRILYNIVAILFTIFFVSAPVALIVNLFLFEEFFNYVALGAVTVVFGAFFIYNIIMFSIYGKIIEGFKYKSILLIYLLIYLFLGMLCYLLLIFPIKEMILWLHY